MAMVVMGGMCVQSITAIRTNISNLDGFIACSYLLLVVNIINPRRACARVTVVVLCVCVCMSVPALAASASVEDSKQRYSRVSLRLFLDYEFSKNPSVPKL